MRTSALIVTITAALLTGGAATFADTPNTTTDQQVAQASIDQVRADYARLQTEMNETLAQLQQLKAQLAAQSQSAAVAPQPPAAPAAQSLDQKIDQIIATQNKLEQKLAAIEAKQTEQAQRTRQIAAATATASNIDLNSPYAYRHNANTPTPSPDINAPQPTTATYTTYSNGYTSGYYVPPVQPVQTTAPVVYVNPQPTVIYTTPTYVYPAWYGRSYPTYYRSYRSYDCRPRSSARLGVIDDHFYFGFSTGTYYGGSYRHHRR